MSPTSMLMVACAAFVGSHLLLSHPLRTLLIRSLGPDKFALVYSLVAFATFGWIIWAWLNVPASNPAFVAGDVAWAIASAVMWFASVLLVGSFYRNPAMPTPTATADALRLPLGVFAITRHPMMWSIALWALVHLLLWPTPENHVLTTAILLLALAGSAGQDRKKAVIMGDAWRGWCQRTSYLPFGAQLSGRASWITAWPGVTTIIGGTLLWLALTWAHMPLGGRIAAGIWRWWGG